MSLNPSAIVALNRAIAVAHEEGPETGLAELAALKEHEQLASYPFYHAALGELQLRRGRHAEACQHFRDAVAVARNPMERAFLERRLLASQSLLLS
jgi:RNA polymerase sigma-70 factor (ECF subfamily)